MRVAVAVLCLTVGMAIGPGRGESVQVTGNPQYQQWADQSLMPSPPYRVYVRNRECEPIKAFGCARRFTIWVPLGHRISQWVFLHELGHVVHRQVLKRVKGDAEQFAEAYAWCSIFRNDPLNPDYEYPGETGWTADPLPGCRDIAGRIVRRPFAARVVTTKGQVR